MFENKVVGGYTYETRYIASWLKAGGSLKHGGDIDYFREWLLSLNLNEDEANHIVFLATNGKLELELSAKIWMKTVAEY